MLRTSEQPADLVFSPDGRSLAATARSGSTSVWTVQDSAARIQLSGFDERISSLAFGPEGSLAVGGLYGDVWSWRNGRCPEVGSPLPMPSPGESEPIPVDRPGPPASSSSVSGPIPPPSHRAPAASEAGEPRRSGSPARDGERNRARGPGGRGPGWLTP